MVDGNFVNIASYLSEIAKKKPHTIAVVQSGGYDAGGKLIYTHYTLEQLDRESDRLAFGLFNAGIKRGAHTVLMVRPGLNFFALTFALFKIGAVPVMIDPGIGIKSLEKCLEEAEPYAFIGIPKAQIARKIFGWGKKTIKLSVTVGKWVPGGSTLAEIISKERLDKHYKIAHTTPSDIAAILFTSGNTGISKGAVYTHGIFDAQIKLIRSIYGIEPGEIDLATFPLFALFGPALGMTSIIPDMDASRPGKADPKKLIQAILDFGATNMFASPALINKIGRFGEKHNIKLLSLKRVISAGAPASVEALKRFSKMLNPGVQIYTPYGSTEALPVCNIKSDEILNDTGKLTEQGWGNCLGLAVPGIDLEIIKISNSPIKLWSDDLLAEEGEIGEITVKGPIVSKEYYNREKATKLAKIEDEEKGGFYHRMGDVGYKDKNGRVWFCGRKTHRVETPNRTFFTIPCEAVFNVHAEVYRTALVGVEKKGEIIPVLCVELEKKGMGTNKKMEIKKELLTLGASMPHTKEIKTILFHPSFPVDIRHNAKINREELALWAGRKLT